jgi:head-tail adaptor
MIQRELEGNVLAGTPEGRHENLRPVFANIEPASGAEYQQAQQMQANVTHKITTEYFAGAHPRLRLVKENPENPDVPLRVFNVVGVTNFEERNRETVWMCLEVK